MPRLFIEPNEDQFDELSDYADDNGVSMQEAILHAVDNFFGLDTDDDDEEDTSVNPDEEEDDDE